MIERIRRRFEESIRTTRAAGEQLADRIAVAARMLIDCYRAGGGVFLFGNGASADSSPSERP